MYSGVALSDFLLFDYIITAWIMEGFLLDYFCRIRRGFIEL